jgi:hypothetical protein
MQNEKQDQNDTVYGYDRAPFYPKDCFRLASLVYAVAIGKKIQRRTSWGGWVTEDVHLRNLAKKPWSYRIAPYPVNSSTDDMLEFLISDAEQAETENDRRNLAELTPKMIQRKNELENLLKANKAMRSALNAMLHCGDSNIERNQAKEKAISALEYAKRKEINHD